MLFFSSLAPPTNQSFTFFCSCKLFNYKREKWLRCVLFFFAFVFHANSIHSSKYFSLLNLNFLTFLTTKYLNSFLNRHGFESCIENIPRYKLTHVFVLFRAWSATKGRKKGDTRKLVIFAIFRCIKSAFLDE